MNKDPLRVIDKYHLLFKESIKIHAIIKETIRINILNCDPI